MNFKFFSSVSLCLVLASISAPAFAQTKISYSLETYNQQEKLNSIQELMTLTGERNLTQKVTIQTINTLKSQYPQVPQAFWDSFLAEMNYDEVNNKIEGIYGKYFTNEDIQGMITFYQTPLGQKIIRVLPQLAQESSRVGQQYGIEAATRAIKKLEAQGYLR